MLRWLGCFALCAGCGTSVQHVGDDAGTAEPANEDRAILQACEVPSPCDPSNVGLVENAPSGIGPATVCLLGALGARALGRLEHETSASASIGGPTTDHTLVVKDDGSVLYARVAHVYPWQKPAEVVLDPGQRCVLKPPSYFTGCLEAIDAVEDGHLAKTDPAWSCAFGEGDYSTPTTLEWFETCELESPIACE